MESYPIVNLKPFVIYGELEVLLIYYKAKVMKDTFINKYDIKGRIYYWGEMIIWI